MLLGLLAAWLLALIAPAHAVSTLPVAAATSSASTVNFADVLRSRLPTTESSERSNLDTLYRHGGYAPLWLDSAGHPAPVASQALPLIAAAAADGLDPADYDSAPLAAQAAALAAQAAALRSSGTPDMHDALDFELHLSTAVLRYLRHLHLGRVDPHALGYRLSPRAAEPDFGAELRGALVDGRLQAMAAGMAPRYAQYKQLREALARYRTLSTDPEWPSLPPLGRTLHPGESHPALVALQQRLMALGDMPHTAPPAAPALGLDPALAEAIKRFQRRHGLKADGAIGRDTEAALQVPLEHRVRQIELAMERLRWLPPLQGRPVVAINIPMFRLWAFAARERRGPQEMAVIVGRALRTRTPVVMHDMRHVIFRPYWNVPRSIVREEMLPKLRRDPGYLERNDLEIVRGGGDDAARVAASPSNLELLAQGALRLRQRPGPRNSLGLVKFVFPNDENIYLHSTPATELFQQARRDFSHGCVRVEDPVSLAQWVLADQPVWTRERIVEAMHGSKPIQVQLTTPVQVLIYYVTAMILPGDSTLTFAADLYGHDKALEAALAARPAP